MAERRRQTLFALVGKFNTLGVSPPEKFYDTARKIASNFGRVFDVNMDFENHPLLEKIVFGDKKYLSRLKQKISELNGFNQEFDRLYRVYQKTTYGLSED